MGKSLSTPGKSALWCLLALIGLWGNPLQGQIYHVDISGEIDNGLPYYLERVLKEAELAQAKAVLLEVNTFGGRVDAATRIKDLLLNTPLLTLAYVNKRAISAGALITLSCRKIGMNPGSSMGAATVVTGAGEKASEKAISYFRAEMRATAERNGRNPRIAEGMVDEEIEIEGLSEKGKLITLTAEEAVKWGMADYVAPTLEAFLDSLELADQPVIYTTPNWAERLVRFLTSTIVSSLLISLGLLGLFFEIKSPGWGVPGTLGLIFLALFFGSHYLVKLAGSVEIILFLLGIALLLLEIFVIPGFGFAGISGILLLIAGIFLSLVGALEAITPEQLSSAAWRVGLALLITIGGIALLVKFGPKGSIFRKIILQPEERRDEGYVASRDYQQFVGKTGKAVSPLRPAGIGEFGKERLDVVSEGDFINAGATIKVIRVEGYRLVVREVKK